jgi:hypothetical protein
MIWHMPAMLSHHRLYSSFYHRKWASHTTLLPPLTVDSTGFWILVFVMLFVVHYPLLFCFMHYSLDVSLCGFMLL